MAILEWFAKLFAHWQDWISGGGLGGIVVIVLSVFQPKMTWFRKVFLFVWCFLFGSSFMAWKDERDLANSEKAEYDRSSSHLKCEIEAIMSRFSVTTYLNGTVSTPRIVFIDPLILNTGSPGVARKLRLFITTEEGHHLEGLNTLLAAPISMALADGIHVFDQKDTLDQKANTPIPTGGEEGGLLLFDFSKNLPSYDLIKKGALVELYFVDIDGRQSTCSFTTDGQNSSGFEEMPGNTPDPNAKLDSDLSRS